MREANVGGAPSGPRAGYREILRPVRRLLRISGQIVVVAGVPLFLIPGATEVYFAWPIEPPLTAAVDGAFYLSAAFLLFPASRSPLWAVARPVAVAVPVAAGVKLLATFLHLDRFSFTGPHLLAAIVAWVWLVTYAGATLLLVPLLARQSRQPGDDPPGVRPLPGWFRVVASLQATAALAVGAWLLVAPEATGWWPWVLTPLTARALAGWFLALGVLAAMTVRENDFARVRIVMAATFVTAAFQLAAFLRLAGDAPWRSPRLWVYLGFFATLAVTGSYGWRRSRGGPGALEPAAASVR